MQKTSLTEEKFDMWAEISRHAKSPFGSVRKLPSDVPKGFCKIGPESLEKRVWDVLQKLTEAYHEDEMAWQSIVSPVGWICIINGKKGGLQRKNMRSRKMN